ncbi:hypothetical protein XBO1_1800047 [Xenorhabdus bovienii str. oregonense]|uniref:Uncharacterized protein n=1 Tax=Xenorhabdus bovienii str. oregonense TaxID=1398202 RepID=A0A077NT19_XENBV|nr:hypothetical protein XBO1_1800047 [Xenorhabdus bovienii str. oregonense]
MNTVICQRLPLTYNQSDISKIFKLKIQSNKRTLLFYRYPTEILIKHELHLT